MSSDGCGFGSANSVRHNCCRVGGLAGYWVSVLWCCYYESKKVIYRVNDASQCEGEKVLNCLFDGEEKERAGDVPGLKYNDPTLPATALDIMENIVSPNSPVSPRISCIDGLHDPSTFCRITLTVEPMTLHPM